MSDARFLAEMHAAIGLGRDAAFPETARAASPSHGALWAHVRRAPGHPVDLATERALRTDPDASRRYRLMLAGLALAHAPMAVAASDGAVRARRVGACALEMLPAEGGSPPLLVVRSDGPAPHPRLIEAARGPDTVRLELGKPVAGASMLALDPAIPEAALLARLLADPDTEIFLL